MISLLRLGIRDSHLILGFGLAAGTPTPVKADASCRSCQWRIPIKLFRCATAHNPYSATIPGKPTKGDITRGITPYTNLPAQLAYSLGPCFRGWGCSCRFPRSCLRASIFGCSVRIQQARAMSKTGFELSSADCPLWYGASFGGSYLLGVTSGIAALIDNCT